VYRAPELLDLYSGLPITEKIDTFSLGVVMFHLLFFKSPFHVEFKLDQMNSRFEMPSEPKVSREVKQLLTKMLEMDPDKRINCSEVWSIIDHLKSI